PKRPPLTGAFVHAERPWYNQRRRATSMAADRDDPIDGSCVTCRGRGFRLAALSSGATSDSRCRGIERPAVESTEASQHRRSQMPRKNATSERLDKIEERLARIEEAFRRLPEAPPTSFWAACSFSATRSPPLSPGCRPAAFPARGDGQRP